MSNPSYFAIVTCRNSERTINFALRSIFRQTLRPELVIVVDDGSSDNTHDILEGWKNIHPNDLLIITNPDLGYDIGRVVRNWNKAIEAAKQVRSFDYHLIMADDIILEKDYAEKVLAIMEAEPSVAIASGVYGYERTNMPRGGGRFVRNSFFAGPYPDRMGYEAYVLFVAIFQGFKTQVIPSAEFRHIRELGKNHNFYEFGASMKTLGYHPIFVFGRFLSYLVMGNGPGRRGSVNMLKHYLRYKPQEQGYNSLFPAEFRTKVRSYQLRRIRSLLFKDKSS